MTSRDLGSSPRAQLTSGLNLYYLSLILVFLSIDYRVSL